MPFLPLLLCSWWPHGVAGDLYSVEMTHRRLATDILALEAHKNEIESQCQTMKQKLKEAEEAKREIEVLAQGHEVCPPPLSPPDTHTPPVFLHSTFLPHMSCHV